MIVIIFLLYLRYKEFMMNDLTYFFLHLNNYIYEKSSLFRNIAIMYGGFL